MLSPSLSYHHWVFASLPLFRSVPAVRILLLSAFKNFIMHCLLLYHFTTVFFASLPLFRSVPAVRISPLSAFADFTIVSLKNFCQALSPSLSFHYCDICLSATFQVLKISSCTVSFFIISPLCLLPCWRFSGLFPLWEFHYCLSLSHAELTK